MTLPDGGGSRLGGGDRTGGVSDRLGEPAATISSRLFREVAGAPSGDAMAEELTPGQRRADALGLLAEAALATDLDRGTAGDRYQAVLHVESEPASYVTTRGTLSTPEPRAESPPLQPPRPDVELRLHTPASPGV